jgi:hypothetical protein
LVLFIIQLSSYPTSSCKLGVIFDALVPYPNCVSIDADKNVNWIRLPQIIVRLRWFEVS